jgi:hypothetical protein
VVNGREIDRHSVLAPVERSFADVVDGTGRHVDRRAPDDDAVIVRPEDISVRDVTWDGAVVVDADIAAASVERTGHVPAHLRGG